MTDRKVAVIVGVGPEAGIGAALCRRYGAEGYHVIAASRRSENIDAAAKAVIDEGGSAAAVVADATSEPDIQALFDTAAAAGPIGFVGFNPSTGLRPGFRDLAVEEMRQAWEVTCLGGFIVGREAVRRMVPEDAQEGAVANRGHVHFTGATASLRGAKRFGMFAVGKMGLRALAQSMAKEFGPLGLHVSHAIVDGGVDGTGGDAVASGQLDPDSIANSVWHLSSQDPSAWTFELDLRPYRESF